MNRQRIERSIKGLSEWQMHVQAESDIDTNISTAIEALKAQLSQESTTSDLISRQAALNALTDAVKSVGVLDADDIKTVFDVLPSVQQEKVQLSKECTTKDTISQQAAIDAVEKNACNTQRIMDAVNNLPSAQPEPAIPLSWIEKYIEWLKSFDNEFANLEVAHISVMVKKWRDEQDETD